MNTTEFLASLPAALDLESGTYIPRTEVVKQIRADLAAAAKAGMFPAGTKFSVRAGIRVEIVAWEGAVFSDAWTEHLLEGRTSSWDRPTIERMAPALRDAVKLAETIADRHNFDHSRIEVDYFHVGYYLTVDARAVEAAAERGIEAERNPALVTLQEQARAAAKALGPKATKSILGRSKIETAGEWSLTHLIKVAARAAGRPVAYDKSRRAWLPVEISE